MSTKQQEKDYSFFTKTLDAILKDPLKAGKFLVISGQQIAGVFDTFENAYTDASSKFAQGSFIIQQAIRPDDMVNYLARAI